MAAKNMQTSEDHVSSTKTEMQDREAKPESQVSWEDDNSGPFQCPECLRRFKSEPALGRHRLHAHQVQGSSPASKQRQRKKELASSKGSTRSSIALPPGVGGDMPDIALGFFYGKVDSLIETTSEDNDVSKRTIILNLIEFLKEKLNPKTNHR
jgi:hypothetical protein